MKYFLFDNSRTEYGFIRKYWGQDDNLRIVPSPDCKHKIEGWLRGVLTVLLQSHKGDTVICWFDFQAVLTYWLGLFTFRRRNIVCINLMLKDKFTLRNRLVGFLYKVALNSRRFRASVTSEEYGEWLNSRFNAHFKFQLVRDVFHESYALSPCALEQHPNTVFCGGNNGRDWHFMIQVALLLPNVNFHFVMPRHLYDELRGKLPSNVKVDCNIPYAEFMHYMCAATLVALPLNTIAPAGLIVLFQAAANHRLIMMTDTVTSRGYITSERGGLLPNVARQWADSITYYLAHEKERTVKADNLYKFLAKECNEQKFIDSIKKML